MSDNRTTWAEVSEQDRMDLIAWYNVRPEDMNTEDQQRLARLFGAGRFEAWDCLECGDRCYSGDPLDWGHFQGACQVDHMSYPGDPEVYRLEYLARMCDSCRMNPGYFKDRYGRIVAKGTV